MDESRKQFEAEIEHSYGEDFLVVNDDGDYTNWITADLWEFWVKSRAAIEIELPESTEFDGPDMSGAQQAISQIRETLTETGIKVKS